VTWTSERLLRELPLFEGLELDEPAVEAVDLAGAEELWRQGQPGDALYVVETGSLSVVGRLPGSGETPLATLGPGDVFGELALLDSGVRTATIRAREPTRLLRLGRADFQALVLRRDESARVLRRRLIGLACSRLRERHRALAATLPGTPGSQRPSRRDIVPAPDRVYLHRLPFFRDYGDKELDELFRSVSFERVSPGALLVGEGERPRALFVTTNGAVEEVIRRDNGAIRVALAGPGRAFGYAAVIAGGMATASAAARERSIVAVFELDELDNDAFAAAIGRDVVHSLRQAERPQARLAAGHGIARQRETREPGSKTEPGSAQ
jgi:CRP-like cAMP-binding protein